MNQGAAMNQEAGCLWVRMRMMRHALLWHGPMTPKHGVPRRVPARLPQQPQQKRSPAVQQTGAAAGTACASSGGGTNSTPGRWHPSAPLPLVPLAEPLRVFFAARGAHIPVATQSEMLPPGTGSASLSDHLGPFHPVGVADIAALRTHARLKPGCALPVPLGPPAARAVVELDSRRPAILEACVRSGLPLSLWGRNIRTTIFLPRGLRRRRWWRGGRRALAGAAALLPRPLLTTSRRCTQTAVPRGVPLRLLWRRTGPLSRRLRRKAFACWPTATRPHIAWPTALACLWSRSSRNWRTGPRAGGSIRRVRRLVGLLVGLLGRRCTR